MTTRGNRLLTRRATLAGAVAAATGIAAPRVVRAKDVETLRFGVSTNPVTPGSLTQVIGEVLGFHKQEGFTLTSTAYSNNPNVMAAFDKGEIDIMNGTPAFQLPLYARNEIGPFLYFFQYGYPYKWDIAVRPDSPLKSYADLKGKTLGVSQFGSSEYPVTRALLRRLGLDPDKDVTIVAVGQNAVGGDALRRGRIDALAYYDYGFGLIEAASIEFKMLPRPDDLPMFGGNFLTAKPEFLEKRRAIAVGYGRANAKAAVFALANPLAAAKVFLKMYPDAAPRGLDAEAAARTVLPPIRRRMAHYLPPYPNTKIGFIRPAEFTEEAKVMGVARTDFSGIATNDLIDEINDFDVEAVKTMAQAYD